MNDLRYGAAKWSDCPRCHFSLAGETLEEHICWDLLPISEGTKIMHCLIDLVNICIEENIPVKDRLRVIDTAIQGLP